MKFGVSANVADLKRSTLASQFGIAADVSSLNKSPLGDYCGLALDLTGRDGATRCTQESVGVGIADSNVPARCNQIQIDISGGDNPPDHCAASLGGIRRITGELDGVLAAILLDLKGAIVY